MPAPDDLPGTIQGLSALQTIEVRKDELESGLERLFHALDEVLAGLDRPVEPAQAAATQASEANPTSAAGTGSTFVRPRPHEIAGLRPDTAQGEDRLGLEREVEALAAVLAAKDVQPPLSVGLFGDWGSGKSFFMRELEKTINRLSQSAKGDDKSPYCERVGQLWFNAWHYMDTDLWASLASEIFEKLAAFLDKQTDEATKAAGGLTARERLFAAAVNTRDVLTQAEQVRDAAQRELKASEKRLETVAGSEAQVEASLGPREILRSALKTALKEPRVNERVREAARGLGLTSTASAATDVKTQVMELADTAGYFRGIWLQVRHGGKRIWILSLALIVVLALLPWQTWLPQERLASLIARITAGLTAVAGFLRLIHVPIRKATEVVKAVRAENDALIERATQKKKDAIKAVRDRHHAAVAQAQARVEEARTELTRIEQQLEELRADRQVGAFIRERFASSDYTKHFGTIARARNDFERLTELFDQVRKELASNSGTPGLFPRIDRIILYIDDLDRCPEDKVFAVMQAVHLLLAMPLFVVVVGVDSRWLVHSLRRQAGALRGDDEGATTVDVDMTDDERMHWQSTPLNYLEKIFQIPFTLRPMESGGFGLLIDDLVQPPVTAAQSRASGSQTAGTTPARVTPAAGTGATGTPAALSGPGAAPAGGTPPAATTPPAAAVAQSSTPPSPAVTAQILKIEEWESTTMKHLFPLIPSPRSAKRFVNVYRLLRATIPENEYDAFVQKDGGDYEVVLLLLAMLTGHPGPTTEILRDLIVDQPAGDWWTFVERYRARGDDPPDGPDGEPPAFEERVEAGRWAELSKDLKLVKKNFASVGAASRFAKRAAVVARFSFQSGRVLLDKGMEAARLARGSGTYGVRRSGASPPQTQR